jgi:hypothetical protein
MRVSEALDLGSIPNVATKNPVSASEMGFLFFGVHIGVQALNGKSPDLTGYNFFFALC